MSARKSHRPHLLAVEDDPRIASMVAKGLRARGHGTEIVSTGRAAWSGAGSADVMLLDLGLRNRRSSSSTRATSSASR